MASVALVLLRLSLLVAIAFSSALLFDDASFCTPDSGCSVVRASHFAGGDIGGVRVELPELGLLGFGVLFGVSLGRMGSGWRSMVLGTGAAAVAAIGLIAVQAFVIGAFCWLCLVVDGSAVVAFGAALVGMRKEAREALPWGVWFVLGATAAVSPLAWLAVRRGPPVPAAIRARYVEGKLNVLIAADHECPHCRRLHAILPALLAPYGDRVHRGHVAFPLSTHRHARDAALAVACADKQGKGELLSDALFQAQPPDRVAARRHAESLGLDVPEFERCLTDPVTDEKVSAEKAMLFDAGIHGVPVSFIGGSVVEGARELELRSALARAARGGDVRGVPAPVFILSLVTWAASWVALGLWWSRRGEVSPDSRRFV